MSDRFDWSTELLNVPKSQLKVLFRMTSPEEDELREFFEFVVAALHVPENDSHAIDLADSFMECVAHLRRLSGSRYWSLDDVISNVDDRYRAISNNRVLLLEHVGALMEFKNAAEELAEEFRSQTIIAR